MPAARATYTVLVVLLLFLAAAVRIAGIDCQLWLDEIWSIRLAQQAGSVFGVFTVIHHDNNHWLNTIVLLFLGAGQPFWAYHVLPELTGIGTVLLGWMLARRFGAWPAFCTLILLSASEFLIEFSTDARGYAPAGFFALLCLWLLLKQLEHPRRATAVCLAVAAVLGLLSHLTFVVIIAGLVVTSYLALRRRIGVAGATARTIVWWAVPLAAIALLFVVDLRFLTRGGGPPTDNLPSQTAAMVLGLPLGWRGASIIGLLAWLLAAAGAFRLVRMGDPASPLFVTAVLFAPVVLFCLPKSDYLHPRYAYVAVPFLFMLMGIELGSWLDRGRWFLRSLVAIAMIAFVATNVRPTVNFLRVGRGDYLGALAEILQSSSARYVVVGSDLHPRSTLMVLDYYRQYGLRTGQRLATINGEHWKGQWPQWIIAERYYGQSMKDVDGVPFVCRAVHPIGSVASGIPWVLYESASGDSFVRPGNLVSVSVK